MTSLASAFRLSFLDIFQRQGNEEEKEEEEEEAFRAGFLNGA
jgi:hypothetical protein